MHSRKEIFIVEKNKNFHKYSFPGRKWKNLLGKKPIKKLQRDFINILKNDSFESYYFESPNINSLETPLEFVLTKSNTLHKRNVDFRPYKEYMKRKPRNRYSLSFDNLSGDTRLVIPYHKNSNTEYGHIKDYVTHASDEEINDILFRLKEELSKYKIHKKIFLSTHGDGVAWLHFRIESFPKYYNYKPYTMT